MVQIHEFVMTGKRTSKCCHGVMIAEDVLINVFDFISLKGHRKMFPKLVKMLVLYIKIKTSECDVIFAKQTPPDTQPVLRVSY